MNAVLDYLSNADNDQRVLAVVKVVFAAGLACLALSLRLATKGA